MKTLIVGSRDSALAVAQAMTVVRALQEKLPNVEIRLLTMKTTGDRILDRTLDQVGGKGLFVKELDAALRDRRADLTVHSLKDVPMEVPEDLPLLGFSRREDPRDVLVLRPGASAPDPEKPIGSASLRRSLQLKKLFPEIEQTGSKHLITLFAVLIVGSLVILPCKIQIFMFHPPVNSFFRKPL